MSELGGHINPQVWARGGPPPGRSSDFRVEICQFFVIFPKNCL